jgi:hypothetical protein
MAPARPRWGRSRRSQELERARPAAGGASRYPSRQLLAAVCGSIPSRPPSPVSTPPASGHPGLHRRLLVHTMTRPDPHRPGRERGPGVGGWVGRRWGAGRGNGGAGAGGWRGQESREASVPPLPSQCSSCDGEAMNGGVCRDPGPVAATRPSAARARAGPCSTWMGLGLWGVGPPQAGCRR